MARVCRTCLHDIIANDYFYAAGSSFVSSALYIKDLLRACIPDFELTLVPDSVLCRNCVSALHIAYQFRTEIVKNAGVFHNRQQIEIVSCETFAKNSPRADGSKLECEPTNPLKEEYRYEDNETKDVEVEVETCNDTNIHLTNKNLETLIGSAPFSEKPVEKNLPSNENTKTNSFHRHFDRACSNVTSTAKNCQNDENIIFINEVTNDVKLEKPGIDIKTVTSYIQRTSYTSRQRRDIKRPYKCSECNFRSDAKAGLIAHRRIHTGEKPFHCTVCPYKARRKAHLEDHMKIHTGERPFKCPTCDKSFITKQFLKEHSRIHTGEKPYRCMQCNFRSRHKLSIANHVKKIHFGITTLTEPRPSICSVCGKCLAGPSSLSTHMKIHTGVKSHLCELCGKHFRERGVLKNHIRTHTGEKPFSCTKCDYIATRKAHLQDHMRVYGNHSKLVQCKECGKRYTAKLLLKKHMKEEHITEMAN